MGDRGLKRGDIRWYTFRLPDKKRPVLILTRNEVVDRLNEIIVVPATRTIRGITSEVILTADDGMPAACALNFDHVALAQRDRRGAHLYFERGEMGISRTGTSSACGFAPQSAG